MLTEKTILVQEELNAFSSALHCLDFGGDSNSDKRNFASLAQVRAATPVTFGSAVLLSVHRLYSYRNTSREAKPPSLCCVRHPIAAKTRAAADAGSEGPPPVCALCALGQFAPGTATMRSAKLADSRPPRNKLKRNIPECQYSYMHILLFNIGIKVNE